MHNDQPSPLPADNSFAAVLLQNGWSFAEWACKRRFAHAHEIFFLFLQWTAHFRLGVFRERDVFSEQNFLRFDVWSRSFRKERT